MPPSDPQKVTIRSATPEDLPVLGRLGALLVRMHHDLDPQRFIPATPQTEQAYVSFLGTQLTEPNAIVLVAEQDRNVLGGGHVGATSRERVACIVEANTHGPREATRERVWNGRSGTRPRNASSPGRGSDGPCSR